MNKDIQQFKSEYINLEFEDENYVEFLDDDYELQELAYIFIQAPWVYDSNFLSHKDYYALESMLKMYDYDLKTTIPLLLECSNIWKHNKHKQLNL